MKKEAERKAKAELDKLHKSPHVKQESASQQKEEIKEAAK